MERRRISAVPITLSTSTDTSTALNDIASNGMQDGHGGIGDYDNTTGKKRSSQLYLAVRHNKGRVIIWCIAVVAALQALMIVSKGGSINHDTIVSSSISISSVSVNGNGGLSTEEVETQSGTQQQQQQAKASNSQSKKKKKKKKPSRFFSTGIKLEKSQQQQQELPGPGSVPTLLKPGFCRSETKRAMSHLHVANLTSNTRPIKILCFVMTHSAYHSKRLPAVHNTWGKRCDKLVILSNVADPLYGTIALQDVAHDKLDQNNHTRAWLLPTGTRATPTGSKASVAEARAAAIEYESSTNSTVITQGHSKSSYVQLWNKLNVTVNYIWETYKNDGYDWYLKADDDSYVIMENLKTFLGDPDRVHQSTTLKRPLIYGRRYSWVTAGDLTSGKPVFRAFFNFTIPSDEDPRSSRRRVKRGKKRLNSTLINGAFRERFYQKFTDPNQPIIYAQGGAGYAMNNQYLEQFVNALNGPDTLRGIPAEDLAHGAVMLYHGVEVQQTRDASGRERFHPESPMYMYDAPIEKLEHMVGTLVNDGPVQNGKDCCSSSSISFHHMTQTDMYELEEILYGCG